MKRPNYPFAAIVGQDEMKLALVLTVICPDLSGVLIRGDKGTAKSTAVRGLAELLPERTEVSEGAFHLTESEYLEYAETLGLEPLFTIKDLAAYLQVSTTTVYRLIKDGALTGTRIGQSLRFTRKNVEGLLERRAVDRCLK